MKVDILKNKNKKIEKNKKSQRSANGVRSHFSSVTDPGGTFLQTWNVETTKTPTFHKSMLIPITIGYLILLFITNVYDLILEDWLF